MVQVFLENHFKSLNFDKIDSLKLVVIDEFDRASVTLQDGLKSFIEDYPEARFIFTTNHIDKIEDELLFWAHDDTVKPGSSYKYRIRFGVLNPMAGTNRLAPGFESYKYQVILVT